MMDRLTKLAANLYPRWWRDRYGDEFAALLEEARPGLGGTLDVLKGALTMQLSASPSWKAILVCAAVGPLIGVATTFLMTPQYSSSATVTIRPPSAPSPEGTPRTDIVDILNQYSNKALSRMELMNLMRNLDLYREERNRMPNEDVLQLMRRNIRINTSPVIVSGKTVPAFQVSFTYPDRVAAPKVVNNVVSRLLDLNLELAVQGQLSPTLEVIDPASLPTTPIVPNRLLFAAAGLAAGLTLGAIAALFLRARRKPAEAPPVQRFPSHTWKTLMLGAAAGLIIALAATLFMTPQYASTATIRILPPEGAAQVDIGAAINQASQQAFGRAEMLNMIRTLNLYPGERTRMPQEEMVDLMRRNIRISAGPAIVGGRTIPAFGLSFTYPAPQTAQKVVNNLVMRVIDANLQSRRQAAPARSTTLEVLDPGSLPTDPIFPNRRSIAAAGVGAGTLLGAFAALVLRFRRKRQPA